jgi:hypothetical protein
LAKKKVCEGQNILHPDIYLTTWKDKKRLWKRILSSVAYYNMEKFIYIICPFSSPFDIVWDLKKKQMMKEEKLLKELLYIIHISKYYTNIISSQKDWPFQCLHNAAENNKCHKTYFLFFLFISVNQSKQQNVFLFHQQFS